MLNIVVPMAGSGKRFAEAGYTHPKPLIPILGVPMVRLVIDNLRPGIAHRFIFICQQQHLEDFDLEPKLKSWAGTDSIVIPVPGITQGAACSVLMAKTYIDNNQSLMIANCDQYFDINIDDFIAEMEDRQLDGLIMTMASDHPKWSFAAVGPDGFVIEVKEKQVISALATTGVYKYRHGHDFVAAAEEMIESNFRVNNEFYVAPVFNYMIGANKKIGIYDIGSPGDGMYGLGTPEDFKAFTGPYLDVARRAVFPLREKIAS